MSWGPGSPTRGLYGSQNLLWPFYVEMKFRERLSKGNFVSFEKVDGTPEAIDIDACFV